MVGEEILRIIRCDAASATILDVRVSGMFRRSSTVRNGGVFMEQNRSRLSSRKLLTSLVHRGTTKTRYRQDGLCMYPVTCFHVFPFPMRNSHIMTCLAVRVLVLPRFLDNCTYIHFLRSFSPHSHQVLFRWTSSKGGLFHTLRASHLLNENTGSKARSSS